METRLLHWAPLNRALTFVFQSRLGVPLLKSKTPVSTRLKTEWLANPGVNLISGLLVALALIPEAIGFSIVCGLDPKIRTLRLIYYRRRRSRFVGGRMGMISAATGAVALALVPLIASRFGARRRPKISI